MTPLPPQDRPEASEWHQIADQQLTPPSRPHRQRPQRPSPPGQSDASRSPHIFTIRRITVAAIVLAIALTGVISTFYQYNPNHPRACRAEANAKARPYSNAHPNLHTSANPNADVSTNVRTPANRQSVRAVPHTGRPRRTLHPSFCILQRQIPRRTKVGTRERSPFHFEVRSTYP